jgi:hypothetical protein
LHKLTQLQLLEGKKEMLSFSTLSSYPIEKTPKYESGQKNGRREEKRRDGATGFQDIAGR